MEVLRGTDARASGDRACVATIGVFDGVHRGHAALFDVVLSESERLAARAAIVTFEPHPVEVLAPDRAPCVLTTIEQRLGLFEERGFDVAVVLPFNREFASLEPEQFVRATLVDEVRAKKVVVGEDFRFGHNRAGDVNTLAELGRTYGFEAQAIPLVGGTEGEIHASQVRRLVAEGDVEHAAELLGHGFCLAGEVVRGDERGRRLGFPTANLKPHPRACLPRLGVYAAWWVWAGKRLPGVVNVGTRPTFKEDDPPLAEVHVLDFEGDLYGEHGEIEFTQFLRPEAKFDGIDALIAQIRADAEQARTLLTP